MTAIVALQGVRAEADQADIDRFLREYPGASQRLREEYARVRGVCRLTEELGPGHLVVREARFCADHGFQKVTLKDDSPQVKSSASETVFCIGSGSAFVLNKEAGSRDYRVEGLQKDDNLMRIYHRDFGRYLTAPFAILGTPLADLMSLSGFRVIDAERLVRDGVESMKVQYESGGGESPDRAWVELDPALGWAIRSGEIRTGATNWRHAIRYRVEYGPVEGGIPVIRRAEQVSGPKSRAFCDFTEFSREPTPVEDFSMTAYGLPDLTKPSRAGTDYLPWLIGTAAVGLAAAYLLRVLAAKSRAKGA